MSVDQGELIIWSASILKAALLTGFGGVVGFLVDVLQKDKPFSWKSYFVYVLTAVFVGVVLDNWLPAGVPGRIGILMIAGTSAYPILTVMQARVSKLIEELK